MLIYILFFILFFFFNGFFLSSFFFPDYRVRSTCWQIYLSIYHQMGTRSVPIGTKWAPNLLTPFPSLLGCFRPLKSTRAQSMDSPGRHQSPLFWAAGPQLSGPLKLFWAAVPPLDGPLKLFKRPAHNSVARSNLLSSRPTPKWPAQTRWSFPKTLGKLFFMTLCQR